MAKQQYELSEVKIKDGAYVSKIDESPVSGSLVSRHKNGSVYTETFVEGGQATGQSKSYNQDGSLISEVGSPLATKEVGVTYQSVSAAYRVHKQQNLDVLPYVAGGFIGIVVLLVIANKGLKASTAKKKS